MREARVNFDAIYKITQALKDRIQQGLTAAGGSDTGVYVGPLDAPAVAEAQLVLFLYRLVPNPTLRNQEHRLPSKNPPFLTNSDSLPLDLYFVLSVGRAAGPSHDAELLKFLGAAMQVLHRDPVLTGAVVEHETVQVFLDPLSTEEISRIWGLFPRANYRTSVAYRATPAWIDSAEPPPFAGRDLQDRLRVGHPESPHA
jgi:hypothetical protein